MQQDVGQVVSGWVKAIKLAIQHVRERGNRVPVIGVDVRKRPDDISEAQARLNRGIGIDIILVVVIDEVMPERLAKNGPGNQREKNADAGEEGPFIARRVREREAILSHRFHGYHR
jgi:hypothetical protein